MSWQSDFVQVNGIRIHYTRTGGDKPALVLLHGITDNGLCWSRVAHALQNQYDIVMVDARGHGLSDKPENGYTSDHYAADFAGLIESLGLGQALLIGHSLGAISAATLTTNYPHLVRGTVLEDPPWRDQSEAQAQMSPEQAVAWMANWRANLVTEQKLSAEEIIAAERKRSPAWHADEFPDWAQAKLQVNPDVLGPNRLRAWDDLTPKLVCPALLVTGDPTLGAIVTPGLASKICTANPKVVHTHIPNTGHSIRRENFDAFLAAVRPFLAELHK